TCHSPHHSLKSKSFFKADSSEKMCLQCHHSQHTELGQKHLGKLNTKSKPWIQNEKACLFCHSMHHPQKTDPQNSCLSCHQAQNQFHKAEIVISDTERAQDIKMKNTKIV